MKSNVLLGAEENINYEGREICFITSGGDEFDEDFVARPCNDEGEPAVPFFRHPEDEDPTYRAPEYDYILKFLGVDSYDDVICISGTPSEPDEIHNYTSYCKNIYKMHESIGLTSCGPESYLLGFLFVPENEPVLIEDDAVSGLYVSRSVYERMLKLRETNKLLGKDNTVEL